MNKRKILFSISIIIASVLLYFLVTNYKDNKYVDRIPTVPSMEEMSVSFQEFISNANSKAVNKPSAKNLGGLGMVYHANNYFEEAEMCYLLAAERTPKEWIWNYYLGCLKRELGDSEKAIQYFKNVLEIQPNLFMAQYNLAMAYGQIGDNSKFEELMVSLASRDKKQYVINNTERTSYFSLSLYANFELARFHSNQGKVDLAINELKEMISKDISFGPAYKQLSVIYAEKGKLNLSKYYSDRSKDLVEYAAPVDVMMDKLNYHSRSETYLLKQIEDAIRSSNLRWALELVNYSIRNVPESKYITAKAIKIYISMNMARKALPYIDFHLESFQNDYKELVDTGKGLSNSGLNNLAKKYFLAAEKLDDEKPDTRARLAGMFLSGLGMKDKAISMIHTLLQEYSNDPAVIVGAVALYVQIGDMSNANTFLLRLKKVDPQNPRINVFKGLIAINGGDTKRAVNYYEKAFKEIHDQEFIITYLAEYYKKNEFWIKLDNLYKSALEYSPNNASLQVAYGSFLINCPDGKIQNPKKAIEYSERAFVNYKSDVQIQVAAGQFLAMSYYQLNEKEKALYFIRKAISIAKDAGYSKEFIDNLKQVLL